MKIKPLIPVLILLFLPSMVSATGWYVDNAATGNNIGTSWANAWQSFANINWAAIKPGDTLFISGGSTSKTYTESWTAGANGNTTHPITIRPGQDAGHNGIVIFDYDADGDSSTRNAINIAGRSYLTFAGDVNGENHLQVRNLRNINDRSAAYGIFGWEVEGILFDHLTFVNVNMPIRLWYATNLTVRNSEFLQVRGDAAIGFLATTGSWDTNKIYNNYIELLFNNAQPPGATYPYSGPDGIQCGDGTSIYNNTIKVSRTTVYTSSQHPDDVQSVGAYVKIYNNEFINIGDSALDLAGDYSNPIFHDVLVYNNIFRIIEPIDPYPEYIRVYGTSGYGIQSITNYKIFNNLFIDNTGWTTVRFGGYQGSGNPTASGNEIKNNIFYNVGTGDQYRPAIFVENSNNFNSSSFSFEGNIYYHPSNVPHIVYRGVDYAATSWVNANEPHGKTIAPTFVDYAAFRENNDFRLAQSDTAAKDAGLDLSIYFTTDKDGVSRPQGSAWDIGAYEYVPPSTNHYVRSDARAGGDGSDWDNAWATLPETLQRGHTYYIADGNYGSYTVDDSVEADKWILIKKATIENHGTNAGWSDTYGDGVSAWTPPFWIKSGYVDFDGSVGGGPNSWESGHGFVLQHPTGDPDSDPEAYGIIIGATNNAISNVNIRHIEVAGPDPEIAGWADGIYAVVYHANYTNILVEYCWFHHMGMSMTRFGDIKNLTIQYCAYSENAHATPEHHGSGVSIWGITEDVTFRYNRMRTIRGTGWIGLYSGTHTRPSYYGNIFFADGEIDSETNGVIYNADSSTCTTYNWTVYQNTFYAITGLSLVARYTSLGSGSLSKNNLAYDCNLAGNLAYGFSGENNTVATTDPFLNVTTADFHLFGSIGLGSNLGFPYNMDMDGKVRGTDGIWDRGAYEFTSGTDAYHPSDSNQDGCVELGEMISFMDRWKISVADVSMPEMMESIGLWKSGTGC